MSDLAKSLPQSNMTSNWHGCKYLCVITRTHTEWCLTYVTQCVERDQNSITQKNLRENRGFLQRTPMEAEELMEDLIQFSLLFFSCLDQMRWMMNGYKKSSGMRRDERFWMRRGPWMWAEPDTHTCVLFCRIIVAVIWFYCHSCGALQGQIQSLYLLHGLHLTDLTSQWTSFYASLKPFPLLSCHCFSMPLFPFGLHYFWYLIYFYLLSVEFNLICFDCSNTIQF